MSIMKKMTTIVALSFTLLVSPFSFTSSSADTVKERVLVSFKGDIDQKLLNQVGAEDVHNFDELHVSSINVPSNLVPVLQADSNVSEVTEEKTYETQGYSTAPQQVLWSNKAVQAPTAKSLGYTGKGVKIAIIDTGIDRNHPDLKVAGGACFNEDAYGTRYCPNGYQDDEGHGTHVAGIIAAQNNSVGIVGVAPNAAIYAVKSLNSEGEGTTTSILAGINWAIQNKMDVINLSLTADEDDSMLHKAVDKAYNNGILVVAAAGNTGKASGQGDTVQFPARYSSVIAVSSVNSQFKRVPSSSNGDKVEVTAPGDDIYSTVPLSVDWDGKRDGYTWMTGTSMAAPFVVGVLALYKEKYPTKTGAELRDMLDSTAFDLGAKGKDQYFGYGLAMFKNSQSVSTPSAAVSTGKAAFTLPALPSGASYNIYRDGQLLKSNVTNPSIEDYGVKGTYSYEAAVVTGGLERDWTSTISAMITEPSYLDVQKQDRFASSIGYLSHDHIVSGFQDGRFGVQLYLKRSEAVVMAARAIGLNGTPRATKFSDVAKTSFGSGYIQSAAEKGIISGFGDGTFQPQQLVTRAEMAILLARAYDLKYMTTSSYKDVSSSMAAASSIKKLAYYHITEGYPDRTFRPYNQIIRGDFAIFLANAEKLGK